MLPRGNDKAYSAAHSGSIQSMRPKIGDTPEHPLRAETPDKNRAYWGWPCPNADCPGMRVEYVEMPSGGLPDWFPAATETNRRWMRCVSCGKVALHRVDHLSAVYYLDVVPLLARPSPPNPDPNKRTLREIASGKLNSKRH